MEFCSRYARDCLSKCCDKFGDCPEYSGYPCYYNYAAQPTSNWNSQKVLLWLTFGLAGIVTLIAFWYCCCRRKSLRASGMMVTPAIGNTMTPAGSIAGALGMATPTPLGATAGFPGYPPAQQPPLRMSMAQQGAYQQQQQLNTMQTSGYGQQIDAATPSQTIAQTVAPVITRTTSSIGQAPIQPGSRVY